jgi:hypothetical protein
MAEQDTRGKTSVLGMRWYRGCQWFLNCRVEIPENVEVKERERGWITNIENCRNRLTGWQVQM